MKYEDGPCISFRSKEKRLLGEWSLKYFTVDGQDSLQYWNNYFGNECTFTFYDWSDLGDFPYAIQWGDTDGNYYRVTGGRQHLDDNVLVILGGQEDPVSTAFPFSFLWVSANLDGWPISRLKYDEVWFQFDVNLKHYELHLENIKKF